MTLLQVAAIALVLFVAQGAFLSFEADPWHQPAVHASAATPSTINSLIVPASELWSSVHELRPSFLPWENLEGHNVVPPVAVSCESDHMAVFGFFFQSKIRIKTWNVSHGFEAGRTGWTDTGGFSYDQAGIAAHQSDERRVDIVYPDQKFRLHMRTTIGYNRWVPDTFIDLDFTTYDPPVALALPIKGHPTMFVARSTDNDIFLSVREDGVTNQWQNLGSGPWASKPTGIVLENGSVFIFALDARGYIHCRKYLQTWGKWENLGHVASHPPVLAPEANGFVMSYRGPDGTIFLSYYNIGNNKFTWQNMRARSPYAPGVASPSAGRADVFIAGIHNEFLTSVNRFGHPNSHWKLVGGVESIIFAPTALARGTTVEVYVVDSTSVIRHFTADAKLL